MQHCLSHFLSYWSLENDEIVVLSQRLSVSEPGIGLLRNMARSFRIHISRRHHRVGSVHFIDWVSLAQRTTN